MSHGSEEEWEEEDPGHIRTNWKSLFSFTTRKHLPILIAGSIFALSAGCVTPVLAVLLGNVFDDFISCGAGQSDADTLRSKIATNCLGMVGLGAAGWFLNSANIHDLQSATSQTLGLVLQYGCRSVASLILALVISWKLALVTLAGIPLFSSIIAYLSTRMKASITAQQVELTHVSKIANTAIASIDTVKCLNGQSFELKNFATRVELAAMHYLKQAWLNSIQIAIIRWMMFGMFVQGFCYGSSLARSGTLSAGNVITTFWACTAAAQSIEQVLPQMIVMEKGKVASVILKRMMRERAKDAIGSEVNGRVYPRRCDGDIEINNDLTPLHVSFSYPSQPETYVLNPSTFFFPAEETTFVIGKSGSGKSTLSQLLMRFYLPNSGQILIDGHSIESLDITWIRKNITLLEQRSVLFNDSVLQNIMFGRHGSDSISKRDMEDSIELAMLQNVIEGLPRGIDTSVGPDGSFLSGGQRQRVAIARARLPNTPILILDEPTSALDQTNRVAIMKISESDFVYILENGSIMQSGFRNELENRAGCEKYFSSTTKASFEENWNGKPGFYLDQLSAVYECPRGCTISAECREHNIISRPDFAPALLKQQTADILSRSGGMVESIEMVEMKDPVPKAHNRMHSISAQRLRRIQSTQSKHANRNKRKPSRQSSEKKKKHKPPSLPQIMGTIVPNLTSRQRVILLVGVSSALAHASATPIFSYCLSQLIGTFYAGGDSAHLAMKWSLAVLGVSCGDGISSFFMHYFLEFCAEAWMDTLRIKAFQRVLNQPRAWLEKDGNGAHRITSYLDQNGEDMRNLLGRFAGFVTVAAGIMAIAVIWSLIVCWKLTLVSLTCGPVIYAITRGFEQTNGRWERICNEANSVASEIFTETFSEIRTVRSLTLEHHFHRKQVDAVIACLKLGLKRAVYTGLLFGMVESTVIFASATIFYYGALLAVSEFSVNDVVQVFSLLLFSIGYAAQILSWIPQINTSREIAIRLLKLSRLSKVGSHEHRGSLTLTTLTPIKLNNVYFRYPSRQDTLVLRNVSLTVSQNSCTAIVGRSGSGKSTIASLLLALYESPESRGHKPTVMLGGRDIQLLHVPTLRSQISIVSQQPTISPGSIHANITYGIKPHAPMASMDSVRAAAKAAGIDELITPLPKGYWTVIGDGGIGLSGGQKQLVVIARALLRHPQILILDEATSSLDPAGAEVVRQTIQRLVSSRRDLTVIIITHAREMIEIADHVVVLDQGVVVEDGSFDVLAGRVGGKLYELMNDSPDGGA
ncbi:hypothetical protein N7493_003289 [Penicillium malachiteum]|uniref:ABC multidrug transporter MDR2 n=1 Tax=Penicillium malachiteum TaxID=1324776 RepID=A0AAD6MZC3_9EURO|nr:hypothetical protein N7493_003289 [Penicillium malachiteum]